jgi:hypothetical protein
MILKNNLHLKNGGLNSNHLVSLICRLRGGSSKDNEGQKVQHEGRGSKMALESQSAPPKLSKAQGKEKCVESLWLDPKDVVLLEDREDRVQGMSGEDLNESDEELLSDQMQNSQAKIQEMGMVKCSNSVEHRK